MVDSSRRRVEDCSRHRPLTNDRWQTEDSVFEQLDRDGFAYYLTLAYMIADPEDWPSFRRAVHGALVASLYLEPRLAIYTDPDTAPDQERALQVLDEVRDRYHPAVTWAGFVLELWVRRLEFQLAVER